MTKYKYYLVDYMTGVPREIYRGDPVPVQDFGAGALWRAKRNGAWSDAEAEVRPLLNLWLKGDFDPEDNEISEAEAMDCLTEWRGKGTWPGRE